MLWFSRSNKETFIAHAPEFSSAQAQEAAYAQAQGQLSSCVLQITGLTAATTSFKILTRSRTPSVTLTAQPHFQHLHIYCKIQSDPQEVLDFDQE